MFRISTLGSTRSPVIVVGPFALKFARNGRGRASNLCEYQLYANSIARRRALLCPAIWVSPKGALLIMRAAEPTVLGDDEYLAACRAWDSALGEDDPFEPKDSDWGRLDGRLVAVDYARSVHDDDID